MSLEPFHVVVEQHVLDDLRSRLKRAHCANPSDDAGWSLGTSRAYLRDLLAYWQSGYDWRAQEAQINAFSQYKAAALDVHVHFLHARGRGPRPMPLLLLHGWPDSFLRYHKVIGGLASPGQAGFSFDVVVPSLPGFAFTGPTLPPATQPTRHSAAVLWHLMTQVLGYPRFAVAGGDGGSVLGQIMAIDHPESVLGLHLTDLGWHAAGADAATLTRAEQKYVEEGKKAFMQDGAYAMVQATRPRSLAAALNDSPVGLASWIIDRFHSWADPRRDIDQSFGKDDLLTNVMIYWVTRTIGSSMHTYFADRRSPSLTPTDRVDRPVALALFPADIAGVPPRSVAERTLRVARWTEMPRGGHFGALEEPELYAADVREFFGSLRDEGEVQLGAREVRDHVHPAL